MKKISLMLLALMAFGGLISQGSLKAFHRYYGYPYGYYHSYGPYYGPYYYDEGEAAVAGAIGLMGLTMSSAIASSERRKDRDQRRSEREELRRENEKLRKELKDKQKKDRTYNN